MHGYFQKKKIIISVLFQLYAELVVFAVNGLLQLEYV